MYIENFDSMISELIGDGVSCDMSIPKERMSDAIKNSFTKRFKKFKYKNRRDYIWSKFSLSDEERTVLNGI